MVNEVNKPPTENEILGERLMASNRNLQDMQAEHRQLMQEMESLRQRAEELSTLSGQQQQQDQELNNISTSIDNVTVPVDDVAKPPNPNATAEAAPEPKTSTAIALAAAEPTSLPEAAPTTIGSTEAEEDPESAEYIRAKFAEIAALKAQYARVQHLINTTNMIEQHIATKEPSTPQADKATDAPAKSNIVTPTTIAASQVETATEEDSTTSTSNTSSNGANVNQELLSTMLNMFTDFSSELRSEADNLRSERDRLRTLKEEIMRHKRS